MPHIIDVSQSVEKDHPMATEFLRMDCKNVTTFFKRRARNLNVKHRILHASQLYRYVTLPRDELAASYMLGVMNGMSSLHVSIFLFVFLSFSLCVSTSPCFYLSLVPHKQTHTHTGELEMDDKDEHDDSVFMNVPIPRSVTEMAQSATEVEELERKLKQGELDSTTVHALMGMLKEEEEEEEEGEEEEEEEEEEETDQVKAKKKEIFTLKNASKEQRKEHKRLVKLQKAQKRKEKMKKNLKKRATKGSKKKGSKSSKK